MPRAKTVTIEEEEPKIPVDNLNEDEPELQLQQDEPEKEQEEPQEESENPAVAALKAQIAELRKSEEIHKNRAEVMAQERAEAMRRAAEREAEVQQSRDESLRLQKDSIESALAAAQAEAEMAQKEIESAVEIGDVKAQMAAYRKLAKAEANITKLEDGKIAFEEAVKNKPQTQQGDQLDRTNLPPLAKDWLRAHPEYLRDPRKNAKIQALHWDVLDEGHQAFSSDYFASLEEHLGLRQREEPMNREEKEYSEIKNVSAPVSREARNSNGAPIREIRLTAEEREIARSAGISDADYAKQKAKLIKHKSNGHYS